MASSIHSLKPESEAEKTKASARKPLTKLMKTTIENDQHHGGYLLIEPRPTATHDRDPACAATPEGRGQI